jgi:hypothetical protein
MPETLYLFSSFLLLLFRSPDCFTDPLLPHPHHIKHITPSMGRLAKHKKVKDLKSFDEDKAQMPSIDRSKESKLPRSFRNFMYLQRQIEARSKKPQATSTTTTTTSSTRAKGKAKGGKSTTTTATMTTTTTTPTTPTPTTHNSANQKLSSNLAKNQVCLNAQMRNHPTLIHNTVRVSCMCVCPRCTKTLELRPGESLEQHAARIDRAARKSLRQICTTESKPMRAGRKAFLERKAERKKRKRDEGRDFDDLQDEVQFGEVADRPPELGHVPKRQKVVPTVVNAANTLPRSMTQRADEVMAKYKQQAEDGTGKSARVLELERAKVVASYRVAKKRKRIAGE